MNQPVERHGAGQLPCALAEAGLRENAVQIPDAAKTGSRHGLGRPRAIPRYALDRHAPPAGRSWRHRSAAPSPTRVDWADCTLATSSCSSASGAWAVEQVGLAGQSGGEFVGQCEPIGLGTRTEIAERADDFLTRALGSEDAFDEDVIEVGLAFVSPRGFADVHICRHY